MELTPMNLYTKVRVLKGVPFDSSYDDVCDGYSNANDQATKLSAYAKYSYDNISPIRLQNVIRLPVCADFIYDCNYIMWQNANFTNKWFYAFITKIDWININCCHVHYELDVWNTWFFDYEMGKCFIEREHVADDRVGQNLFPEHLETGDYIWDRYNQEGMTAKPLLAVVTTLKNDGTSDKGGAYIDGNMIGKIYSGLNVVTFDMFTQSGRSAFSNFLSNANNVPKSMDYSILGMYMVPRMFNGHYSDETYFTSSIQKATSIDGYVPNNNKLLCYPYNFIHLSNSQGTTADFKYEYFNSGNTVSFRLYGDISGGTPEVAMIPTNYCGEDVSYDNKVVISNFPQVAWVSDTYRQWWALNKVNVFTQFMDTGLETFQSLNNMGSVSNTKVTKSSGNPYADASGMGYSMQNTASSTIEAVQSANKMANVIGNAMIHKSMPPQIHTGNSGNVLAHYGKLDFYWGQMCIRKQFAVMIDDYFTKFGYQVNRLDIPTFHHRSHWDYIKTVDCTIDAKSMSLDDVSTLKDIFNRGTTVWHELAQVGNMSPSRIIENRASIR